MISKFICFASPFLLVSFCHSAKSSDNSDINKCNTVIQLQIEAYELAHRKKYLEAIESARKAVNLKANEQTKRTLADSLHRYARKLYNNSGDLSNAEKFAREAVALHDIYPHSLTLGLILVKACNQLKNNALNPETKHKVEKLYQEIESISSRVRIGTERGLDLLEILSSSLR